MEEGIGASASQEGVNMTDAVMVLPAGAQTLFPKGKVPHQRKEGATDFTEGSTVMTRSMQKKKDLSPCKSAESLPSLSSLSGLLVQAIASCKSDNGLNFPELKKMLSGKGYDVTRRCPSIKRKMHNLASKGAFVRMTNSDGSTLFVIRKYPEKTVTTRLFEGSKQTVLETKQDGAERRKNVGNFAKTKGVARQAKSAGWKSGEAGGRLQRPDKKLKPGEKQQRHPSGTSKSGSAKRSQSLIKKAMPTTKSQHHRSGIRYMPTPKGPCQSNDNAATPKRSRNCRSRTAKKLQRSDSSCTVIPKGSRLSASHIKFTASVKRLQSPYNKETLSEKKPRYCRSKTAFPSKGQSRLRNKTTASLQNHSPTAVVGPVLKSRRRPWKDWI